MAQHSRGSQNDPLPGPVLSLGMDDSFDATPASTAVHVQAPDDTVHAFVEPGTREPEPNYADLAESVVASPQITGLAQQRMQSFYKQHKHSGAFVCPSQEQAFRLRVWTSTTFSRRVAVVAMWITMLFHLQLVTSLVGVRGGEHALWIIPSYLAALVGFVCLAPGLSSNPRVLKYWDVLAAVGMVALVLPMLLMYVLRLCDHMEPDVALEHEQCVAKRTGQIIWSAPTLLIMVPVVTAHSMHISWVAAGIATALMNVIYLVMMYAYDMTSPLRVFGIVVCCVVTTVAARSQEMLGRNYSASLGVTALAHRMQLDAEKRGLSAQKDREAAQAQATAFQNVMRYVCHELRNPLHGIMGLLEGVRNDLEGHNNGTRGDLDVIWDSAKSMAQILNDVLDLGQLQRGHMALHCEPTDCVILIEQCISTLAGMATVPIQTHFDAALPRYIVVDPLRLSQVVTNAVSNAAKNTSAGHVAVTASFERGCLHFQVVDTGCGLKGDTAALFRPYAQGITTTARLTATRFERGTGLGLAISSQLVRLMGGTIGLENRSDGTRGARFWFTIPCRSVPRSQTVDSDGDARARAAAKSASSRLRHKASTTKDWPAASGESVLQQDSINVACIDNAQRAAVPVSRPASSEEPAASFGELGLATDSPNHGSSVVLHVNDGSDHAGFSVGDDSPTHRNVMHVFRGQPRTSEAVARRCSRGASDVGGTSDDGCGGFSKSDTTLESDGTDDTATSISVGPGAGTGAVAEGVSAQVSPAPPRFRKPRRARKSRGQRKSSEFEGVHVLVVDDERVNRTVLKRHCARAGCTVTTLADGEDLVSMVEAGGVSDDGKSIVDTSGEALRPVNVVFLDILMQRSNGEDVCKTLRGRGLVTPVVAATGNGLREDLERYQEAGFSGVLLKPFSSSTVADVLRQLATGPAGAVYTRRVSKVDSESSGGL